MMLEELLDELARLEALSKDQPNDESLVTEIVAAKESVIAEFFKIGLAAAIKRIAAWLVSHPQEKYPEQMLESFGITLGDRTVMNQLSLYLMAVIYILPMCRRSRKFISGIMKKIIVCFLMAGTCVYFMYADTYTSHTARTMYYVAKIKWLHGMDYDNFYGYIYNSRRQADLCDNAEHQRQLYLKFQVSLHSVIQYFDHTVFRDAKKVPNPNYLYSLSVAKSLTGCLEANQDVYLMWEGGEAQYRHDLAVLLNWQGNFYYYLKEYSKAEELVNQSFAQDDLTNNYALRSSILCEEGRTDEALKDINTAISRNSNKSTYFKTRAKIHRKRGEEAQAEEDKRRAEEISSARRNKLYHQARNRERYSYKLVRFRTISCSAIFPTVQLDATCFADCQWKKAFQEIAIRSMDMTVLRYLFSCKGRMGRKSFIFAQLCVLCVFLGLGWALSVHSRDEFIAMLTPMGEGFALLLAFAALAFLVIGIWSTCIAWPMRRLHDMGKSGIWAVVLVVLSLLPVEEGLILLAISLIEVVFFLYLLFKKGQDEENEYGLPQT